MNATGWIFIFCCPIKMRTAIHIFVLPELFQETGDDQNDDHRGTGQGQGGQDASGDPSRGIARIGGHVDADGTGGGFRYGDHIGYVRVAEPAEPVRDLIEEGQGGQAAAYGKEACFKELYA